MLRWFLAAVCLVAPAGLDQQKPQPASRPADSQPASRPVDARTTLRKPAQAETLRKLLAQQDRPMPIKPRESADAEPTTTAENAGLMLEGTILVERPGRLVREEGNARFVFYAEGDSAAPRDMRILESQLLETMEREADAGFSEFIVSGEVTRYRGNNYLLLRKVLRRTANGNLAP